MSITTFDPAPTPPASDTSPRASYDPFESSPPPPPPHHEHLAILPMTPDQISIIRPLRSASSIISPQRHIGIPMGLYMLTPPPVTPVPQGWIEFVHPEGPKYYYQPARRIVTDSDIKHPLVLQALIRALATLDTRLNTQNLILPQTTEVVFRVNIDQDVSIVRYYFVDHTQKTVFWLEETNTESLGCPPVTSYTHLKCLFRQYYWTHIEFYPMHLTLSAEVEDELVAILTHACIDYMTSSLSTVPYNQEQCEAYLRLIRNLPRSDRAEGYRNCVLARLWSEIDGNFFVKLYGEDVPRLSHIQRLPEPSLQGWLMRSSSEQYERALNGMWADKVSHVRQWWESTGSRKVQIHGYFLKSLGTFLLAITCALLVLLSLPNITETYYSDSIIIHTIFFSGVFFVSVVIWLLARYLRGRREREEPPMGSRMA